MTAKTTAEIAKEILKVADKDHQFVLTETQKLNFIESIIADHVYNFAKLNKNVIETSLKHELYERYKELYVRFGIYDRPVIIINQYAQ